MSDLVHSVEAGNKKLIEFRKRYSKEEYPLKIGHNLVYTLLLIEKALDVVDDCFVKKSIWSSSKPKFENFDDAVVEVEKLKARFVQETFQKVEKTLLAGKTILGIDTSQIRSDLQTIDNIKMENMEYTYVFNNSMQILITLWLSIGLMGETKIGAFQKLTNISLSENLSGFSNQMEILKAFYPVISIVANRHYKRLPNYF